MRHNHVLYALSMLIFDAISHQVRRISTCLTGLLIPDGHSSRKRQVLLSPPYMHKLSLGGEVFRRLTSPKQGSLIFYRSVHSYTILHRTTNFSMNNHLGKRGSHSIPKGTVLPWKIYWQMAVKWFTIPMNNHFNNHF